MSDLRRSSVRIGFSFLVVAGLLFGGCASGKKNSVSSDSKASATSPDNALPSGPEAKINVSYSRPDDFLTSLTVTEYAGAQTILTESGKNPTASIIRFEGGIVIWQIGLTKKLMTDFRMLGERKPSAVTEISYGKLPPNFASTTPDSGPPPPLQPEHYYVFAATRASGAISYEAVKVNGDGSLEAYAADPRAGDSFRLCCDVAADFVLNANEMTTSGNP